MQRLWARSWLFVGHDSQVPAAGDFVTTTLAGQPVVMLRQADGGIGVLFTLPIGMVIASNYQAHVYREYVARGGEAVNIFHLREADPRHFRVDKGGPGDHRIIGLEAFKIAK